MPAPYNRTESKTQVTTRLTASVSIAGKHIPLFNTDLLDSLNFRKDVIGATQVITLGTPAAVTVDFSTRDLAVIDAATNSTDIDITINNTANGEDSKYIEITKTATKTVTFAAATDLTTNPAVVDAGTSVIYQVFEKNGVQFVNAMLDTTINAGLSTKIIEIGDWNMDSTNSIGVAHGLTLSKIRGIESAIIRDDGDTSYFNIDTSILIIHLFFYSYSS